jgi:hypothetical protein
MSRADLATFSLLDPDQGVCPNGHPCRFDEVLRYRHCGTCDYRGPGLTCWEITSGEIDRAELAGADPLVVDWARAFVADKAI